MSVPVSWVERVVDRPNTVPRLAILLAAAVGYLSLFQAGGRSPLVDWGFAFAAVATGGLGGLLPLFTAVAHAVTLGAADLFGTFEHGPAAFVKYVAVWSLFELAIRCRWSLVAVDMGILIGVYTLHTWAELPEALPALLYRVVVTVVLPALVGAYIRATRTLASQVRQRAAQEREHHATLVATAVVAERTALARELHDLVAHHVSAMVLRIGSARHVLGSGDPRVAEVLDVLHRSGTAALADLRRLVAVLRDPNQGTRHLEVPIIEPDELLAALIDLAEHYRTTGIMVDVSVDQQIGCLDSVRASTILRLTQEGLANVARHAGPRATVQLTARVADSGDVHLRIVDDGGGRATDSSGLGHSALSEGFGLIGMRERVECLGGQLQAAPAEGGWELTAILPDAGTCPPESRS